MNSVKALFTQAVNMWSENGLLPNLALGSGIVWREVACQEGCAGVLPTSVAFSSCCICASTCDMADVPGQPLQLSALRWQFQAFVS